MTREQQADLERATDLYNRGRYLDCQEVLERLHLQCDGGDQALVKALAMIACGMHIHFRRGGGRGALNLMRQSLVILDDLRPTCAGVATAVLYDTLFAFVEEVQGRRKSGAWFLDRWLAPKIPMQ